MKKNFFKFIVAAGIAATLTSCGAMIGTTAGMATMYTDVQEGAMVTSNHLGSKVGRATAKNILGIAVTGDASINTAAKSAGITKISHVDRHVKNILGIMGSTEIIVYGE